MKYNIQTKIEEYGIGGILTSQTEKIREDAYLIKIKQIFDEVERHLNDNGSIKIIFFSKGKKKTVKLNKMTEIENKETKA